MYGHRSHVSDADGTGCPLPDTANPATLRVVVGVRGQRRQPLRAQRYQPRPRCRRRCVTHWASLGFTGPALDGEADDGGLTTQTSDEEALAWRRSIPSPRAIPGSLPIPVSGGPTQVEVRLRSRSSGQGPRCETANGEVDCSAAIGCERKSGWWLRRPSLAVGVSVAASSPTGTDVRCWRARVVAQVRVTTYGVDASGESEGGAR